MKTTNGASGRREVPEETQAVDPVHAAGNAPAGSAAEGGTDEGVGESGESARRSGLAGWPISAGVHALIALAFAYVVFAVHQEDQDLPPMQVPMLPTQPKPEVHNDPHAIQEKTELVLEPVTETPAPVTDLVIKPEDVPQTDDEKDTKTDQGRENQVATSEEGANRYMGAIGPGNSAPGRRGTRDGGGHHRAVGINGGTRRSEDGVEDALRWFKKHQSANGMWDAEKYQANCTQDPKCEPGSAAAAGGSDANIALTGYAVLCFLGRGYDHKTPSKYKATVQKALDYLRSVQKADGLLGVRNYEHAVGTYALSDAYSMTADPDLKVPAQRAVNLLISRQAKDPGKDADKAYSGLGWDYEVANPARNDSSVSGWCVMALKSALGAGLNVGSSMEGSKKWLERAWKAANKDWMKLTDPYSATSSFPYTWDATSDVVAIDPPGSAAHDMAPVGALCAVFLGHHAGSVMLESLCNHIAKYQFPTKYPCNTYYLYYDTAAMFQAGGERWKRWNATVRDMLVNAQRGGEDCFSGSWDPQGTVFHGNEVGRVLSTAYCCLCLEVYYRQEIVGHDSVGR